MKQIEIYTTPSCGYCQAAKHLLTRKGVAFTEIGVAGDAALRDAMIERAGGQRTVPQIFVDGHHLGGCDDLYALDRAGKLDPMLGR